MCDGDGTPGIGKSIFYAYFFDKFWRVHRDEWIVIAASHERDNHLNGLAFFDNDGGTMTYPWPDDKTLSNVLNALTTRLAKQRKEDEGKREVDKQKVFFLCDGPPPARREQMAVFVSSNEDWMQKVVKDDCCLFMPMWTPDELQKAALVLNFALDDAVIDQRYSICGGVARQCLTLWEKSVTHAKDRMLEAIAEITNGDDLQNLILGKMIRRTRHRLLHDEPDPADKGKRTTKLASPFVRAKLEGQLLEKSYADREKLRKSLASVSEATSLCGMDIWL